MVIKSLIPNIDVPEIGIIDLIFAKENGVPEDRELMIDVYTEKKITYAQLKDDIARFNAGAQDKFGFGEGDVSVIFAPNQVSLDFFPFY
jgi:acyl-CoA synthetase (AMP-forming)/AMP-acid ligase II